MPKSPCIGCELESADKNNPTCRECEKRVEYVAEIGRGGSIMGATNTGNQGSTQRSPLERISKQCVIDGCDRDVFCRGLCEKHYKQWRLGKIEHPVYGMFSKIHKYPGKRSKRKEGKETEFGGEKMKGREYNKSGTKNKLIDLNDHMFAQLERLSDEDLKGDKLAEEISRSRAVTSVGGQIINNARLALDAHVKINELLIKDPPKMLGAEGFKD